MVMCFKLFGKSIKDKNVNEGTGSAFFVAEHYLLTCKHNVSALSPGDKLKFCYRKNEYNAELVETAKEWDLALLYTETSAEEAWIFPLDRIAPEGREAIAYGYPHGGGLDEQRGLVIGTELDKGVANLTNANGVTVGFSGGPVCQASDRKVAVGVIITIKGRDRFGRQVETAGFVYARVALELWGDQYGLHETRYEYTEVAYGSNSFVCYERKTDFQDPNKYLERLQGFLNDSSPVLWWAIVGQGGSGKSRLCLELASSLNSNWRCELLQVWQLDKGHLQGLYDEAGRDFLLIADYAYANTGELGNWLDERARATDAKNKPHVRVLLLQREKGRKDFGWQHSLLCGHGNLINLRYQEDMELAPLRKNEMVSLMCSYAENVAGRQINAEELYEVLQSVDPGLTRPLFAMFIVDAVLHEDDPRGWDQEKAFAYFTQREKDVVDLAFLDRSEDARAAKLLLVLATICGEFAFDADILGSSPLSEIQELMELQDKANFGLRMINARLAERGHRHYIVKPLKPDLLGEYYVLEYFTEMMNDPLRKEFVPVLLGVAEKENLLVADDFLTRLFTDFKTNDILACLCCGKDYWRQFHISWGLIMRHDTDLLCELYKVHGTELWLEQYAKGLVNAFDDQSDEKKAGELLEELRELHRKESRNAEVAGALASGLLNAIGKQSDEKKAGELLEELRELHRKELGNAEVAGALASSLFNAFLDQSDEKKAGELMKELQELRQKEPGNAEVAEAYVSGLYIAMLRAIGKQSDKKKAGELLEEFRERHRKEPGNVEVAEALARRLSNAIGKQSDEKKVGELLEELRELHRKGPRNAEVVKQLASGLFNAIGKQSDEKKAGELLEELRELHRKEPGNAEVVKQLASGLFNAIGKQSDEKKAGELLEELRELHRKEPGNAEVAEMLANGLFNAFHDQCDEKKAGKLLEELRELHRKEPENAEVAWLLSWGLVNAIHDQCDEKKVEKLLEELRELHRKAPGNAGWVKQLARGLVNAIGKQCDEKKAGELLEELRELHRKRPWNAEVAGVLAVGLYNAFYYQCDEKKAGELLEELRELHQKEPGNEEVVKQLASGLFTALYDQSDEEKAGELLEELRELHRKEPWNAEVSMQLTKGLVKAIGNQSDMKKVGELRKELHELL